MNDASETLFEIFNCLHRSLYRETGSKKPLSGKGAVAPPPGAEPAGAAAGVPADLAERRKGGSKRGGGAKSQKKSGRFESEDTGPSLVHDTFGLVRRALYALLPGCSFP